MGVVVRYVSQEDKKGVGLIVLFNYKKKTEASCTTFIGIVKRQTAAHYLQTLEKIGLLDVIRIGKDNYYINKKLVKIMKS